MNFWVISMHRTLWIAAIALTLVGCRDGGTPIVVAEAEVLRPEPAALAKEIQADRKAVRAKYEDKIVEFSVERLDVRDMEDDEIECDLSFAQDPNAATALSLEATFYLSDGRNAPLKGIKTGPFRATIRGKVRDVVLVDAESGRCIIKLDPAWVEAVRSLR
ncbi:MAG TPA: hypothetical protein VHR66_20885 [Gemmataceae bacterium]|jgi:hypothetical protein|nr:hypothetical protein [Gemmataceae bacterium]